MILTNQLLKKYGYGMQSESMTRHAFQYDQFTKGSLWWRRFMIRIRHWEYWPIYVFNFPVLLIWLWHALRARDLFFFTTTNPGIATGGFFGESKSQILRNIPDAYKPHTVLWETPVHEEEIEDLLKHSGLVFPLIAKPEVGERGWLIARIHNLQELKYHVRKNKVDLILQPFVTSPMEVSVMVYEVPGTNEAAVTSICEKEFLHVRGDGISTIYQLVMASDRAVLQYDKLMYQFGHRMDEVLPSGESVLLEPIGNHCRGTKFINRNDRINEKITEVMVKILKSMPGIHYGRFDMKINSWEELEAGKGIRVLEFNGTSSDPAHIYDPQYSLVQAYRDIFYHWGIMRKIASVNRKAGVKPVALKKVLSALIIYFRYKRAN